MASDTTELKDVASILLGVAIAVTLPGIIVWASSVWRGQCDCRDAVVTGHVLRAGEGRAYHQLELRGARFDNDSPCTRRIDVGIWTYIGHSAGDSIHFKENPL